MRKADSLPPSCAVVMKSGNLNILEPSGPLQTCNGTALPLPLPCIRVASTSTDIRNKYFPEHKTGMLSGSAIGLVLSLAACLPSLGDVTRWLVMREFYKPASTSVR